MLFQRSATNSHSICSSTHVKQSVPTRSGRSYLFCFEMTACANRHRANHPDVEKAWGHFCTSPRPYPCSNRTVCLFGVVMDIYAFSLPETMQKIQCCFFLFENIALRNTTACQNSTLQQYSTSPVVPQQNCEQ